MDQNYSSKISNGISLVDRGRTGRAPRIDVWRVAINANAAVVGWLTTHRGIGPFDFSLAARAFRFCVSLAALSRFWHLSFQKNLQQNIYILYMNRVRAYICI